MPSDKQPDYYRSHLENTYNELVPLDWDKRVPVGQHEADKDEPEPKLPKGYSFVCANGCGDCLPVPMQFFTSVVSNNQGKITHAAYHKVYAANCCRYADSDTLQVFDDTTDELVGYYSDFIKEPQ